MIDFRLTAIAGALIVGLGIQAGPATAQVKESLPMSEGKYADVNGLKMYYEDRGEGEPLVLLHGAFGLAMKLPMIEKNRRVIAVELQGHGHTADIDRPLSPEQMADDVAALLEHLKIEQADVFGYSMGGKAALGLAIRHPKLVRKLVVNGTHYSRMEQAFEPATYQQFLSLPADFAPPVMKDPYDKVAPDPSKWSTLVAKIKTSATTGKGFSQDDLKGITASVMLTQGDHDSIRLEHALEMYRLIPKSQLAIVPGGDHFLIFQTPEKLLPTVAAFFDAP